jgi:leader peptidase (prepilin peptidase)/N-methyltransferase
MCPEPSVRGDGDLTADHRAIRPAIGAATAVATIVVAVGHRGDPMTAALLSMVVLSLGTLSAIDIAEQRLPNRITVPLAGGAVLAVLCGGVARADIGAAFGAVGVGLAFALMLLVLRFGMGDVKLALPIGTIAAWLGQDAILATVYVGAISGATVALILIAVHRRRDVSFGFGPCLALGSVAGMVAAAPPL